MNPEASGIAVCTQGYDRRLGFGITRMSIHTIAARPISGRKIRDNLLGVLKPRIFPVFGQNCKYFFMKISFPDFPLVNRVSASRPLICQEKFLIPDCIAHLRLEDVGASWQMIERQFLIERSIHFQCSRLQHLLPQYVEQSNCHVAMIPVYQMQHCMGGRGIRIDRALGFGCRFLGTNRR